MKRMLLGCALLLAACDGGKVVGDVIGGVGEIGLVAATTVVAVTLDTVDAVGNADKDNCAEIATPEAFANTGCEQACDDAKASGDDTGIANNCPAFAR
jgi:hypothetical protein